MYQNRGFGLGGTLSPAIKNIIYANVVLFIVSQFSLSLAQFLISNFALTFDGIFSQFKIWQLVTYMFLHGGFLHILFNMFFLWMFGTELEYDWGTKEFVKYYFITGIGGAVFNLVFASSNIPTLGASAAVYGVMLAFALKDPDRPVYLYFLFPIKVKYLIGFLVLVSFFSTLGPQTDGIAHAAHLGGAVVGFVYLKYWYLYYKLRGMGDKVLQKDKSSGLKYTKKSDHDEDKIEYYRQKIDELLDKINKVGYLNLSEEEKRLLEEGSKYLREHDSENFN